MSQWNNSYAYNNQYQAPNNWSEQNGQYVNHQYYTPDTNQQYVSFNEFITQMQNTNTNYNNVQYNSYPDSQYSYQNMPSTSQTQLNNYNYGSQPSNTPSDVNTYHTNKRSDANQYASDIVSKSNLTPTATEFVPKSSIPKSSSSSQRVTEAPSSSRSVTEAPSSSRSVTEAPSSSRSVTEAPSSSRSVTEAPSSSGTSSVQNTTTSYGSSSDRNWRERPSSNKKSDNKDRNQSNGHYIQESNRNNGNNSRNRDSYRNKENNSRHYESASRNSGAFNEPSSNQEPNREYENSSRNERRNQSKGKSKKESDNRTFYNSSINKEAHDTRNGRGEGSGKQRNWAGSQRLRGVDRNNVDDEDYANSYVHTQPKDKKIDREKSYNNRHNNTSSPARYKQHKNQGDQVNKEMTQRERLTEQLDKGTLECLVCCDRVRQTDSVWSCGNCYHVFHLNCIRKWATSSTVEGKWRCPACQNATECIPSEYRCMCGAVRSPEYHRGSVVAHTCGMSCMRPRSCPHPCTLLCHPGPCPPCQATVNKQCGCGAETRSVLCSSKLPQVCGRVCGRLLACGDHKCVKECHEGPCDECDKTVTQVCGCPASKSRSVSCGEGAGTWSCGERCGRVLACGAHVCRDTCHQPPCAPCARDPALLNTCPCGKIKLDKEQRKSCTDPIPLCGNICAKPLSCGPEGDKHFCKIDCHEGACPVCPDTTLLQCRCGHSSREVPCADLPEMLGNVLCQKKCNKKLSCGRHRCRSVCCAASSHRCAVVCGRTLPCGLHRCEEFCHTGHCAPCPVLSFEELRCACGATCVYPPVACGTRAPACPRDCPAPRPCGHPPHHACHAGACPPCVVLTAKRCHGNHEERKTIPCSQEDFSCGLPCGKPLPCGKHTCIKPCHKGPCDTSDCTQPCLEKRPSCGHPCGAACHAQRPSPCPSTAPCRVPVAATCACGRRAAQRTCSDNARDYAKMVSALAATKLQEGGSVDLSDVQRPANMLKTLECDESCRAEARSRALALALQIRNPDVSAKLAPRYSEHVRATALRDPAFANMVHDKLTELVQLAKKSKQKTRSHSFPSMNRQKRQFIHEMCEHFGCESVAYDAEPNRNVVATADREKSWLPALSVSEVLCREAGRRRVPGPVLRPPAPSANTATKSSGGWAKLTSTNAWAARSQPKPSTSEEAKEPKIDYFDNPPEN